MLGQLILDREMGVSKGADLMKGANFGRQLWMFSWEGCGFQKSTNRNLLNATFELVWLHFTQQFKHPHMIFQRKQTSIMATCQPTRPLTYPAQNMRVL